MSDHEGPNVFFSVLLYFAVAAISQLPENVVVLLRVMPCMGAPDAELNFQLQLLLNFQTIQI